MKVNEREKKADEINGRANKREGTAKKTKVNEREKTADEINGKGK